MNAGQNSGYFQVSIQGLQYLPMASHECKWHDMESPGWGMKGSQVSPRSRAEGDWLPPTNEAYVLPKLPLTARRKPKHNTQGARVHQGAAERTNSIWLVRRAQR